MTIALSESIQRDYAAIHEGAGLAELASRGLIQLTGRDRAGWLNNLCTNVIKTLEVGAGNYAFAINLKGRILFDMNMLVLPDAIWLDVDRTVVPAAMKHFDRYIITEDVQLADRSGDFVRLALVGPRAGEIIDALGAGDLNAPDTVPYHTRFASHTALDASASPAFQPPGAQGGLRTSKATLVQKSRLCVRTDFCGPYAVELYTEASDAEACRARLMEIGAGVGLRAIGTDALDVARIEAGLPAGPRDIHEEILPAETMQTARAVNFKKGCYLGQEVVERMRSHNVLARRLVTLRLSAPIDVPVSLHAAGADGNTVEAGFLTSACVSPKAGGPIALGYAKAAHAREGTTLHVGSGTGMTAIVSPPVG